MLVPPISLVSNLYALQIPILNTMDSKNSGKDALRNPIVEKVAAMSLDGASDAPRGSTAGSHRGSVAGSHVGSHAGSHAGSRAGSPPRRSHAAAGEAKPLGYDPGRDLTEKERETLYIGKRVDLPADAYITVSYCFKHRRPSSYAILLIPMYLGQE